MPRLVPPEELPLIESVSDLAQGVELSLCAVVAIDRVSLRLGPLM
jgi:hypothetical protein